MLSIINDAINGSFLQGMGGSWLPGHSLFFFRATPTTYGISQAGVQSELQLQAYTTATATGDSSQVCDLHHRSWQCQIFNPLIEARD